VKGPFRFKRVSQSGHYKINRFVAYLKRTERTLNLKEGHSR
jgi:hypothetical protein